jgi:hypothetical protein
MNVAKCLAIGGKRDRLTTALTAGIDDGLYGDRFTERRVNIGPACQPGYSPASPAADWIQRTAAAHPAPAESAFSADARPGLGLFTIIIAFIVVLQEMSRNPCSELLAFSPLTPHGLRVRPLIRARWRERSRYPD